MLILFLLHSLFHCTFMKKLMLMKKIMTYILIWTIILLFMAIEELIILQTGLLRSSKPNTMMIL